MHSKQQLNVPTLEKAVDKTEALWISISPSLGIFDQPLQLALSRYTSVSKWQYAQTLDESCEIQTAVELLEEYLSTRSQPIHLLGHGTAGVVALLYARANPEKVKSLILLAVAEQPAVNWHAQYYVHRHLLACSQERVLAKMAGSLFRQRPYAPKRLIEALRQDLEQVPLLHSACHLESVLQGGVNVPLMVCGAEDDSVVHPEALDEWTRWLKPGDRKQLCKDGSHFFHYFHSSTLARKIYRFWTSSQFLASNEFLTN